MPTPLRTPQTSGHSSFCISDLPLWSLKLPPSHGSKIIIFYLSQSKCTVSALFLRTAGRFPRQIAQNTPLKVYLTQFLNQYIIGLEINYRKG